jgi:hypothetical protein
MKAYTKFIRPALYIILILFNLYAFISNDPAFVFSSRYINLMLVLFFSAMFALNFWLQNKLKK